MSYEYFFRHLGSFLVFPAILLLPGCDPTPTADPGPEATAGCQFSPTQGAEGLSMTCTVQGAVANQLIDPIDPNNSECALQSLTLFDQQVNAPMTVVWGVDGFDQDSAVMLGATINAGSHTGRLAKSAGEECSGTTGPTFDVNAIFAGSHRALISKEDMPACVHRSALDLNPLNVTIEAGIPWDVTGVVQASIREDVARQLDLELARAANRWLQPNADTEADEFVERDGRCEAYEPLS